MATGTRQLTGPGTRWTESFSVTTKHQLAVGRRHGRESGRTEAFDFLFELMKRCRNARFIGSMPLVPAQILPGGQRVTL